MDENAKKSCCGCLMLPVVLYVCLLLLSLVMFAFGKDSVGAVQALTLEELASATCNPNLKDFMKYPELAPMSPDEMGYHMFLRNLTEARVPAHTRLDKLLTNSKAISDVSLTEKRTEGGLDLIKLNLKFSDGGSGFFSFLVRPKRIWPTPQQVKVIQGYECSLNIAGENLTSEIPGTVLAYLASVSDPKLSENIEGK